MQQQLSAELCKAQAAAEVQALKDREHQQQMEQQQRRLSALKEKCSKAKDTALQRQLAIGHMNKKHHGQVTDLREQVAGLEVTQVQLHQQVELLQEQLKESQQSVAWGYAFVGFCLVVFWRVTWQSYSGCEREPGCFLR
jgi:uncharacterized coiled-coil protein SlyX